MRAFFLKAKSASDITFLLFFKKWTDKLLQIYAHNQKGMVHCLPEVIAGCNVHGKEHRNKQNYNILIMIIKCFVS